MHVTGIVDDSREAFADSLFVAIRGDRVDGHAHVADAVKRSVAGVCTDRLMGDAVQALLRERGIAQLCVPDTLCAFHQIAAAHRRLFAEVPVIAVTGSSGKTSCRAMVEAILEKAYPGHVLATAGNTNNHFGVPRNVLRLRSHHRAAVLELGTNHPGEIASLAAIVQPTVGVITNVGHAHLEYLLTLEGVAREKGALFSALPPDGVAVFPQNCEQVEILRDCAGERRKLTFGASGQEDVMVNYYGLAGDNTFKCSLRWLDAGEERMVTWAVGGRHQASNAAAAAAACTALGIDPDTIAAGLAQTRLPAMRMEICRRNGIAWVNDAYNANPDSVRAAVEWFLEVSNGTSDEQKIVVLGDMLELGNDSRAAHETLLEWVAQRVSDARVVTVGPLMMQAAAGRDVPSFLDAAHAVPYLERRVKKGTWLFLKGSRGMHLESVISAMQKPQKNRR